MDKSGVEREYRKRRKLPQAYLLLVGVVMLNGLIQTGRVQLGHDNGLRIWTSAALALLMVATLVRIVLEQYRAHTRVTAAGITVRGAVRSRTWAWQEVYDIRVQPSPRGSGRMAPQWLAYLYDMEGRRVRLPHLDDWQLDDPYAEVSALRLAAAPHRGLTWERRPQVEEDPAAGRGAQGVDLGCVRHARGAVRHVPGRSLADRRRSVGAPVPAVRVRTAGLLRRPRRRPPAVLDGSSPALARTAAVARRVRAVQSGGEGQREER